MAVKIIIRHDSASNWTSANPTLSLGELGFDTDSKKYKLGDGTTAWNSLSYAGMTSAEITSAIETAVSAVVDLSPSTLDTLNELAAAINDDPAFFTTVETRIAGVETAIDTHNNDLTDVHGISDTRNLVYETQLISAMNAHASDTTDIHGIADTANLAVKNNAEFTGTLSLPAETTIETVGGVLQVGPNQFTTLSEITATAAEINTLDGITATTAELNTLDGITATASELNILDGATITTTELNYVDGVTSSIQTQINTKAPIESPTFTGTVSGITKGMVGLGSVDNTADTDKPISTATQTALDAKASSTDLSNHASDTTNIHGIADTAELETQTGAQSKADAAEAAAISHADVAIGALTTSDIEEGTNQYFTNERAQDAVGNNLGAGLKYTDSTGVIEPDLATYGGLYIDPMSQIAADGYWITFNFAEQTLTNKTIDTASNDITVVAADISDVTASAAELNVLDGITASTAELNILDGVTASAAELNILDGATVTTTELNYVGGVTSAIQTQLDAKSPSTDPTFTGTVALPSTTSIGDVSATELGYVNGVTSGIQTQLDGKADLSGDTFTGDVVISSTTAATSTTSAALVVAGGIGTGDSAYIGGDLIISGDFTVNGTTTTVNATDLSITDPLIYIGEGNSANSADLGMVASFDDGTYQHAGIVRDSSDGKWKFFKGVIDEPTSTVNFTQGSLDAVAVGAFEASSATIGNVSDTEIQYLNGVTSAIQTQLDAKAPTADPTFTGTVSGITKAMVGLGNVDNTSDANKPISTDTQSALDLKADLSGPTFSGTVSLPSTTSIGDVSSTEIGYVNGVTSAIQDQIDGKQATITGAASSIVSQDLTSNKILISGSVGKVDVSSTDAAQLAYLDGVSSAIQDQLDDKAPIDAPTFTGAVTVSGSGVVFTDATQTKAGVPSITTITQKTASYTLSSLGERDTIIEIDSTSATTLTIPLDSSTNFPVGTTLDIIQTNTGQVTIEGANGVTVNATPGLKLRTRWSSATLLKRAENTWLVFGDLSA
jgi:hypothetical protein